jgi:hypothetical protein
MRNATLIGSILPSFDKVIHLIRKLEFGRRTSPLSPALEQLLTQTEQPPFDAKSNRATD